MNILVVGGGSTGERHLRCFLKIKGLKLSVCEPYEEKLKVLREKYRVDRTYKNFDDIDFSYFNGMVIATPPNLHIPMAIKSAKEGCHLLIEKPLSLNLSGIDRLKEIVKSKNLICGVGYTLRNFACLNKVKALLSRDTIGRVLSIRAKVGQFFPDARPDYKNIYFSKKEMGGGIILDDSHELNYLQWLFGEIKEVSCFYDTLSLEIETEDIAVILLRFGTKAIGEVHLNAFQKDDNRRLEVIGEKGTITCDLIEGRVGLYRDKKSIWQYFNYPYQRDDNYIRQARNFINTINGKEDIKTSLNEGVETLKVCLSAKESAVSGRVIKIKKGEKDVSSKTL